MTAISQTSCYIQPELVIKLLLCFLTSGFRYRPNWTAKQDIILVCFVSNLRRTMET